MFDHLVTASEADFVPEILAAAGAFMPDSKIAPHEIIDGKVKTAEWLQELGIDDDEALNDAEKKSAQQAFAALTTPLDVEEQKKALSNVAVPGAVKHLVGMLTAYDWAFVEQAKELRGYCIAQLLEETKHPDAKVRLKSIELLGKVTEVALFTERVELKKTELSDSELQVEIDKRMGKYMHLMKVVDGETLDNEAPLAETTPQTDDSPAES